MNKYIETKTKCCDMQTADWVKNRGVFDKRFFMNHYKTLNDLLDMMVDNDDFVLTERLNMFQKMTEVADIGGGNNLGMGEFQVRRMIDGYKWWDIEDEDAMCDWVAVMGPGQIEEEDVINARSIIYIGEEVTGILFDWVMWSPQLEHVFFHANSKCKTIQANAFKNCSTLRSINLPPKLEIIHESVFERCFFLKKIIIPDRVTSVGVSAFSDCLNLIDVVIGKSVVTIDKKAFYKCSAINTLHIPDSVKVIGDQAFGDGNGSLTTITGLKNLEFLGSRVFEEQAGLESIHFSKSLKHIGRHCFKDTDIDTMTLVYNDELVVEQEALDDMPVLRIINLHGGTPEKWKSKLSNQKFKGCDLLIKKAMEFGVGRVVDYVVDARKLEQEAVTGIGKNMKDVYFRQAMRGWSPRIE
jgi:hypothetical protein